jgi:hypothetical protein
VDVQTGYLADELSLETLQVAVKENLDLSAPPILPNEQEVDETGLLPDPINKDFKYPKKINAVPNP